LSQQVLFVQPGQIFGDGVAAEMAAVVGMVVVVGRVVVVDTSPCIDVSDDDTPIRTHLQRGDVLAVLHRHILQAGKTDLLRTG
jgi:hypothetical protein